MLVWAHYKKPHYSHTNSRVYCFPWTCKCCAVCMHLAADLEEYNDEVWICRRISAQNKTVNLESPVIKYSELWYENNSMYTLLYVSSSFSAGGKSQSHQLGKLSQCQMMHCVNFRVAQLMWKEKIIKSQPLIKHKERNHTVWEIPSSDQGGNNSNSNSKNEVMKKNVFFLIRLSGLLFALC